MLNSLRIVVLVLALSLEGCSTVADFLRGTFGGTNSDDAALYRTDAKNLTTHSELTNPAPNPSVRN